jgi:hypothetical protein
METAAYGCGAGCLPVSLAENCASIQLPSASTHKSNAKAVASVSPSHGQFANTSLTSPVSRKEAHVDGPEIQFHWEALYQAWPDSQGGASNVEMVNLP